MQGAGGAAQGPALTSVAVSVSKALLLLTGVGRQLVLRMWMIIRARVGDVPKGGSKGLTNTKHLDS